jgi:hypothetical protein
MVLHEALAAGQPEGEEPLMNILGFWQDNEWRLVIFPRARHRPGCYFKDRDQQSLISPAAVEMGGVCTTPREQDLEKVTREQLVEIFDEVCISKTNFAKLKLRLQRDLAAIR